MAEKYYNKKPPEFGIPEYSGGLIFVPDIPVFFLLNLVELFKSHSGGHCRGYIILNT
jgi:hypothetical protein